MIWACFSYYGVGPIHCFKTIMDQHVYVDILQNVMLPYAEDEMPFIWVLQQDNDPTSKKSKKWFADNIIYITEWPPQSADLNPIENLSTDVKKAVHTCNPTSNEAIWMVVIESWKRIPITKCYLLFLSVDSHFYLQIQVVSASPCIRLEFAAAVLCSRNSFL